MPNIQQAGVIALIKSALTKKAVPIPEGFDFLQAIRTAKKHNVSVMLYYGAIECGISQESPEMQYLFSVVCQNMMMCEKQKSALGQICAEFDKAEIDYMPLKGSVLRDLYPKPEMRAMGDADILIKLEEYEKIKNQLTELGYTEGKESEHELKWHSESLYLELHKCIISPKQKDYFEYWTNPWDRAEKSGGYSYKMKAEDMLIYLITHLAIHYRAGGIGIKHITDIWLFLKANEFLNEKYIEEELVKLRLFDFYNSVKKLLSVWFFDAATDEKTEFMTSFIFSSGVFGTYERNALARAVIQTKKSGSAKKAQLIQKVKLFFLPYKNMCIKYPFLKKAPFLLPFMWIVRIVNAMFFGENTIKKLDIGLNSVTTENIEEYHESLKLVGLDFDYKE